MCCGCAVAEDYVLHRLHTSSDDSHKPFDVDKSCSTSGRHPGTV